jgi:hypothetical protein
LTFSFNAGAHAVPNKVFGVPLESSLAVSSVIRRLPDGIDARLPAVLVHLVEYMCREGKMKILDTTFSQTQSLFGAFFLTVCFPSNRFLLYQVRA